MRVALKDEVISQFSAEMSARLPRFNIMMKSRGLLIWNFRAAEILTFFVGLQIINDLDQFTVEIAWSDSGKFPWNIMGETSLERPCGRERLGTLWKKLGRSPVWDLAPEKAVGMQEYIAALSRQENVNFPTDPRVEQVLPRIQPLVFDAANKLEQYGTPLFQAVAQHRGISY